MLLRLFLLFTVVPLVELALLLALAQRTGWQFALVLVLVTGVVGAALARWQGLHCVRRLQDQLAAGQLPADPIMDGLMILVAGALLITPGMLTDLVGFALLTPAVRKALKYHFRQRWTSRFHVVEAPGGSFDEPTPPPQDRIIDVKIRPDE